MDRSHNPEFTCMELYVQYKDYNWMMGFTEQLLEKIAIAVNGTTKVQIGDHEIDFKAPYRRLPILDAIKEKTGLDLASMSEDEMFKLLASDGLLVKRPIAVADGKVLVGFKEAEWEALK